MFNPMGTDFTTDDEYEPLDFPWGNSNGPSGANVDNNHNVFTANGAFRFQNNGPVNIEQPVYNLVEDLSAVGTGEAVNNGNSHRPTDSANNSLNYGINGGLRGDTEKPEPIYYVIEELSDEATGRAEDYNDLPTVDPVYCAMEELNSEVSTQRINVQYPVLLSTNL